GVAGLAGGWGGEASGAATVPFALASQRRAAAAATRAAPDRPRLGRSSAATRRKPAADAGVATSAPYVASGCRAADHRARRAIPTTPDSRAAQARIAHPRRAPAGTAYPRPATARGADSGCAQTGTAWGRCTQTSDAWRGKAAAGSAPVAPGASPGDPSADGIPALCAGERVERYGSTTIVSFEEVI